MKIFVMEGCPSCKAVKEAIELSGETNRFTFIDINDGYEGFMPSNVPIMQHTDVGTLEGEQIFKWLGVVYGKDKE